MNTGVASNQTKSKNRKSGAKVKKGIERKHLQCKIGRTFFKIQIK